jgi:hypothetical protein
VQSVVTLSLRGLHLFDVQLEYASHHRIARNCVIDHAGATKLIAASVDDSCVINWVDDALLRPLAQAARHFAMVDTINGLQILNFDGRMLSQAQRVRCCHKVYRERPHGEVRVRGQGEHMVLRFQVESAWFVSDAAQIWCNEGAYTFVFQRRVC